MYISRDDRTEQPGEVSSSDWSLEGRTVVITGGNVGIGRETAHSLAECGAHVVLGCRRVEMAREAAQEIEIKTGQKLDVLPLDLAQAKSVNTFAANVLQSYPQVDMLINNAGVMPLQPQMTPDGFEACIGTNFLGHFLLTNLLLDRLKQAPLARIVHVSSLVHHLGRIDMSSFRHTENYNWMRSYSQSKLAIMLFNQELARRLVGTGVTTNALHPGIVGTHIIRTFPTWMGYGMKMISVSPKRGAKTSLYVATNPELTNTNGAYFWNSKVARQNKRANDKVMAAELWQEAERLTGLA